MCISFNSSHSSSVESHLPVTNRLALLLKGTMYDIDSVDKLVDRYSTKGFTVVLHLKDEVNIKEMFSGHFEQFVINDTSEVGPAACVDLPKGSYTLVYTDDTLRQTMTRRRHGCRSSSTAAVDVCSSIAIGNAPSAYLRRVY